MLFRNIRVCNLEDMGTRIFLIQLLRVTET